MSSLLEHYQICLTLAGEIKMDKSNKEDIRMNGIGLKDGTNLYDVFGRCAPLIVLSGIASLIYAVALITNASDPTGSIVNKSEFLRERKRIVAKYADTNRDSIITEKEESDLCRKIIEENNAVIYEDTVRDNDGRIVKYKGLIKFFNDYDVKMSGRGN